MTFGDVVNILVDVADAFTTGELEDVDVSFIEQLISFEFEVYAELSLISTAVFTPGLFVDAQATGTVFGIDFNFKMEVDVPVGLHPSLSS